MQLSFDGIVKDELDHLKSIIAIIQIKYFTMENLMVTL